MSLSRLSATTGLVAAFLLFSACDSFVEPSSALESSSSAVLSSAKGGKDKPNKIKAKDLTLAKCKEDCTINTVTINVTYDTSGNTTGEGDAGDIDAVTLVCFIGDDGVITDEACKVSN